MNKTINFFRNNNFDVDKIEIFKHIFVQINNKFRQCTNFDIDINVKF